MPFFNTLGGSQGRGPTNPPIINLQFTRNVNFKSNDWYHKPALASSWSRSSSGSILRTIRRRV